MNIIKMASYWLSIEQTYNYIFNEMSHLATKDYILLIRSPLSLVTIIIVYNLFCIKIGPMIMKNRPPYTLNMTIKLYNIFQILINSYLVYNGGKYIFSGYYNFQCQGPDEVSNDEMMEHVSRVSAVYFFTKLTELLDTVLFVLRKSDRQITFLHLYHHSLMSVAAWVSVKYFPGGQQTIIGTINSLIHVFMYIYYLLSGMGPQYQKYLWWKKYMTIAQIIQFVVVLIHVVNSLFYSCSYPAGLKVLTVIEAIVFIYMFSKFYYRTYIISESDKQDNNNGTIHYVSKESSKPSVNGNEFIKKKT